MQKYLTLFIALLSLQLTTRASEKLTFQFAFGGNLSIPNKRTVETFTDITGHPETHFRSRVAYFVEFMPVYNLNESVAIQSGLNYNLNKQRVVDKIGFYVREGDVTLSYLQIPILFQYRFSEGSAWSFSLGPDLSFRLKAIEEGTSKLDLSQLVIQPPRLLITDIYDFETDISENFTQVDFGLSANVAYCWLNRESFSSIVFARFNYGFRDVITHDITTLLPAEDWRNYSLMVGVGFAIH